MADEPKNDGEYNERRGNNITHADLRQFRKDLKSDFDEAVNPIRLTLYGADGREGVVGDVNAIKTSGAMVKWLAGSGLLVGLASWAKHFFK